MVIRQPQVYETQRLFLLFTKIFYHQSQVFRLYIVVNKPVLSHQQNKLYTKLKNIFQLLNWKFLFLFHSYRIQVIQRNQTRLEKYFQPCIITFFHRYRVFFQILLWNLFLNLQIIKLLLKIIHHVIIKIWLPQKFLNCVNLQSFQIHSLFYWSKTPFPKLLHFLI